MADEQKIDLGTPGASARREHERRRAKREEATHERHPHLGKLLLRFQSPPREEANWDTGAGGEEKLGADLARRCPEAIVLHDRGLPGKRTNIDHLAVAPSGVYVIDAKRLSGKIEVRRPSRGQALLFVKGRNRTKLVEGLERQRRAVRDALAPTVPELPVHACFCFLDPAGRSGGSGIPLLRTLRVGDIELLHPRRLAKRLSAPGALGSESTQEVARLLALALPRA